MEGSVDEPGYGTRIACGRAEGWKEKEGKFQRVMREGR